MSGADRIRRRAAAGVVLAGGRSSRMGRPKAWLDVAGTPLLVRTVGVLAAAVDGPVVVVAAAGQELPALPAGVEVVHDPVPDLGPLPAIGTGLTRVAAPPGAAGRELAFVAAVDLPLLRPAFVGCVLDALGPRTDVALPVAHGHHQPLAAAYRTALGGEIEALTAAGQGRPPSLFERVRVRRLDEAALRADPVLARHDPDLDSLTNVNTPGQWAAALARLRVAADPDAGRGTAGTGRLPGESP